MWSDSLLRRAGVISAATSQALRTLLVRVASGSTPDEELDHVIRELVSKVISICRRVSPPPSSILSHVVLDSQYSWRHRGGVQRIRRVLLRPYIIATVLRVTAADFVYGAKQDDRIESHNLVLPSGTRHRVGHC